MISLERSRVQDLTAARKSAESAALKSYGPLKVENLGQIDFVQAAFLFKKSKVFKKLGIL